MRSNWRDECPKTPAATAPQDEERIRTTDDTLTIVAISIVAGTVANVLHEGVGHGLTALLIGAKSGVLTTVAWSSASDTPLVAAGGTLVNLAAALAVFWLALRSVKLASMPMRYFLLIACAFNLFTGTGYFFFFRGITLNFGDWAAVIFRAASALALAGAAGGCGSGYFCTSSLRWLLVIGLVRYVGIP